MKLIYKIIICLSICFAASCSNFLVEAPTGIVSLPYQSKQFAERGVIGIYPFLTAAVLKNGGGLGCAGINLLEYATGRLATDQYIFAPNAYIIEMRVIPDNAFVENWWKFLYQAVEAANIAIKNVPLTMDAGMSDASRTKLVAEARFLRALTYFYLVQIWGDIPMRVDPIESEDAASSPRVPVKRIYDEIILPDLIFAEAGGLPKADRSGRASLAAVKSLMATVYLTMAGAPLNETNYYALAAEKAKDMITMTEFKFDVKDTKYNFLKDASLKNKGEHIFSFQFDGINIPFDITNNLVPETLTGTLKSDFYKGGLNISDSFKSEVFSKNDNRLEAYIYNEYKGVDLMKNYIYKFFDKQVHEVIGGSSNLNWPVFRLSDIYLVYCEAQNMADGAPDAVSLSYINNIRKRAGLSDILGFSGAAFTEAVWAERNRELCFENKMWFDMKRTLKVMVGDGVDGGYNFIDLVGWETDFGFTYEQEDLYMPIPQTELDTNPGL